MDDGSTHMTWPMRRVEARLGRDLGEYLREQYVDLGRTTPEIADALGVSPSSVARWISSYGIELRFPGPRKRPEAAAVAAGQ